MTRNKPETVRSDADFSDSYYYERRQAPKAWTIKSALHWFSVIPAAAVFMAMLAAGSVAWAATVLVKSIASLFGRKAVRQ